MTNLHTMYKKKKTIGDGMEEIKVDTYRAMTVKHAAPLPWLVRLVVSSRCWLGWSSLRGVGWAGRLFAVLAGLVVSSRCWLGWSSRRVVGWAGHLVVSAWLVVS
jgi:hypothetical protein